MDDQPLDEATIGWEGARTVFTQVPDWILTHSGVNDGAFRTWMVLASFTSNKDHTAFPAARSLMEMRGRGRRVIFQHLAQLEAAGLLRRESRYRANGGRTSNHYTLAWDRPFKPPVQKPALGASADSCTPDGATDRAAPGAPDRATRTRTTKELDPLPPSNTVSPEVDTATQGAPAPRTPRSKESRSRGRRRDGTNPRAVKVQEARFDQMKRWAQNMMGPLEYDEFAEIVESERGRAVITDDQAQVALDEARRLAGSDAEPVAESVSESS